MSFIWKPQFILWNFVSLALLKIVIPYSDFQFAVIDVPAYTAQEVFRETNNFRNANGLPSLEENFALNSAAVQKLQDMLQNQYFAHVSPTGISPWHWFEVNDYDYSFAGENLAIGFIDASGTVQAWADSPSHRKNMMDSGYTQMGIAVTQGKIKDIEGNVVVQLFGTPVKPLAGTSSPITLSFSGTQAQEEELILAPNLEEPIVPIYAADKPAGTSSEIAMSQEEVKPSRLNRLFGSSFLIYSFLAALISVSYVLIRGATRERLAGAALHVIIFYAAALLPSLTVTRITLIG
ncbi:MAG: CAP domain-containing protein [Candidatus Yanofskybacteria bacterium]|nr:CAP domain-containing protein [Candidatus Yanofskybacteria bacterium]